jgi:predicted metal-dependent phosphoesterase TrpH
MTEAERPGKADLHVHTTHSDGMATPRQILDWVENETDLDVLAITDHDSPKGALATRELWAKGNYRFDFIPGMEVTSIEGHIIALFVEEPLPALAPVEDVLAAIHAQGGLAVAAHPLAWITRSLNKRDFARIAVSEREGVYLDALETANESFAGRMRLREAAAMNRKRYHLAEVGASDGHFTKSIATAWTEFPGRTAEELRKSILERRCRGVKGRHPGLFALGPLNVAHQAYKGIMITPRMMGWGPTINSFVKRTFARR